MRRTLVVLFAVLVAISAACGAEDQNGSVTPVDVAQAAENTVGAGSARVSMTGTGSESFTGEGEFAGDRGRFSMSFPDAEKGAPAGTQMIFANDTMYVSLDRLGDVFPAELFEGKKWLQVDLDAADQGDLGDFVTLYSGDPTRILEELETAGDFEELGREEVRGAETTRYHGTVEDGPIDVWIDEDGLLRRFQFVEETPESKTTTVTVELYDFGADVDVEAPPADEVATMDELFQAGS